MHSSLHRSIINHQTISLKEYKKSALTVLHSNGFLPLHLAAFEGQLGVMLKVLLADDSIPIDIQTHSISNISPPRTALLIAIQQGHRLIAEVLLACGAKKELAIELAARFNTTLAYDIKTKLHLDNDVVMSVLYLLISVYYKYSTLKYFTKIFNLHKHSLTKENMQDLYDFIIKSDLSPLRLIVENFIGDLHEPIVIKEKENFSPVQKHIFNEIKSPHFYISDAKKNSLSETEIYGLLEYAHTRAYYFIFSSLIGHFVKDIKVYLELAIFNNNPKLAKLILIAFKVNIHDFTIKFYKKHHEINSAVKIYWSLNGFIAAMVSNAIGKQSASITQKKLFSEYRELALNKIKNNLIYRYPDLAYLLHNPNEDKMYLRILNISNQSYLDLIKYSHLIFDKKYRFDSNNVINNKLLNNPFDILRSIFNLLNRSDILAFKQTSRLAQYHTNTYKNTKLDVIVLQHKVDKLFEFMHLIKKEIKEEKRVRMIVPLLIFLSLYLLDIIALVTTAWSTIKLNEIAQTRVFYPGSDINTCYDVALMFRPQMWPSVTVTCMPFTDKYRWDKAFYNNTKLALAACYDPCIENNYDAINFLSIIFLVFYNLIMPIVFMVFMCKFESKVSAFLKQHISPELKLYEFLKIGYGSYENPQPFGQWAIGALISYKDAWNNARQEVENLMKQIQKLEKKNQITIEIIDDTDEKKSADVASVSLVPAAFFNSKSKNEKIVSLDPDDVKERDADEKKQRFE